MECLGATEPISRRLHERHRNMLHRFSGRYSAGKGTFPMYGAPPLFWHHTLSSWEVECKQLLALLERYRWNAILRSFFQGLCVLGYCIAPLDIAALVSCFVRVIYIRAPIALLAWAWCIWGKIFALAFGSCFLLTPFSVCQFSRWNKNWTAAHYTRCVSASVGLPIITFLD